MVSQFAKYVTTCQSSYGNDQEFVVACKNRPFTSLTSQDLPMPEVALIDHKLVSELRLRMSDLQCSKFNFGSKKLRILGKISSLETLGLNFTINSQKSWS